MKPLAPKDPREIGGFTLVGRLGAGGMGVVYLASRKSETVALKVVRDSLLDDEVEAARFTREISTLEKIRSPYVAKILETGVDDGRAWFAVEFVNGPNLSELVQDKGPLDEDRWWELARGLLRGLADVHATGVLHRDVKPANVILAEGGPKLIDFGIAHVSDATSVTATGLVAGSPAWFSPEQLEGFELTSATDVFSAGSVLTYAATGSSPWGGETVMTKASVFKILTSEPDVSGLSQAQTSLVSVMLGKEASDRPTAGLLLENLESLRNGEEPKLETSGVVAEKQTSDDTIVGELSKFIEKLDPIEEQTTGDEAGTTKTTEKPASRRRGIFWTIASVAALALIFVAIVSADEVSEDDVSEQVVSEQFVEMGDLGSELLVSRENNRTTITVRQPNPLFYTQLSVDEAGNYCDSTGLKLTRAGTFSVVCGLMPDGYQFSIVGLVARLGAPLERSLVTIGSSGSSDESQSPYPSILFEANTPSLHDLFNQFIVRVPLEGKNRPESVSISISNLAGEPLNFASDPEWGVRSCGESTPLKSAGPVRNNSLTFFVNCGLPIVSNGSASVDIYMESGPKLSYVCDIGGECQANPKLE